MLMATTERSIIRTTGQSASDAVSKPKLRLYCRTPSCKETATSQDGDDEAVEPVVLPYVFRYLANELAAMNVKMKLEIK
jgi:DNA-directed RNA polymerase I subunit RPA2